MSDQIRNSLVESVEENSHKELNCNFSERMVVTVVFIRRQCDFEIFSNTNQQHATYHYNICNLQVLHHLFKKR